MSASPDGHPESQEPARPAPPDPAARAAKRTEIADRRKRIAQMHLSRVSQKEIANQLGVSEALVCRDLKVIREAWKAEYTADLALLKQRECAALDLDERRARARLISIPDSDYRNFCRVSDVVLKIMDRRSKLLGLDAPQKIETTGDQAIRVEFVNDWQPVQGPEVVDVPSASPPPPGSPA